MSSNQCKDCPPLVIYKNLLRSRQMPAVGTIPAESTITVSQSEYVYEIMIFNNSECSYNTLQIRDSLLGGILPSGVLPVPPLPNATLYDVTMSYFVESDFVNLVSATTTFTNVVDVASVNLLNSTVSRMDPFSYARLVLYIVVATTTTTPLPVIYFGNNVLTNFQNTLILTGNVVINRCKSISFVPQYVVTGVNSQPNAMVSIPFVP
jgi:hypothetical protein